MVQVRKNKSINYDERDTEYFEESELVRKTAFSNGQENKLQAQRLKAPKTPVRNTLENEETKMTLVGLVKQHGTALAVAAKDLIQKYKCHRAQSTAEILSFIVQACGLDYDIPAFGLEDIEVDHLKQELDEKAQLEGLNDPFKARGKKNFRSNYLELWDKIIREAYQADTLFDQFLLDRVISLVTALNTSIVRDFRRVATLTAVQLVTSFIHVTHILEENLATAERQLGLEEKKKSGKGANKRIVAFKRSVDRTHLCIKELTSYTSSLFQAVCQHRFRDCANDIRACVIDGIGHWIRIHPSEFLKDEYLKYIAWALSDKDAVVRCRATTALLGLYTCSDNISPLHDFTERFSSRFKELLYDVDEDVAVRGVQLLTVLVRANEIPATSVKEVYTLLGDASYSIRHAVADLLAEILEDQGGHVLRQGAGMATGKKQRRRSVDGPGVELKKEDMQLAGLLYLMHLLARFEEKQPLQDDADLDLKGARPLEVGTAKQVVDALYGRVDALSNWDLITNWLKSSKAAELFGHAGVTNLAQVLCLAVIKATRGTLLPDQPTEKKARVREVQEALAKARQDATLLLMKELPTLLKKLQTDPIQVSCLVAIVPEMKLELYSLKRQENGLSSLLNVVLDIMFKHEELQVAQECIRTIAICAQEGPESIKEVARLSIRQCSEVVVKQFVAAAVAITQEDGDQEEELAALSDFRLALGRLKALQLFSSIASSSEVLYNYLNAALKSASSGTPMVPSIITALTSNMFLLLLWRLRGLNAEHADEDDLKHVSQKGNSFVKQLELLLHHEDQEVRVEACLVLSDMFLCFGADKLRGSSLEHACIDPTDAAVQSMWNIWEKTLSMGIEDALLPEVEEKIACNKRIAASKAAQLVIFQAIPQRKHLAAQLISHYVEHEKEVTDIVKELCRLLKNIDSNGLPDIYLEAMKLSFLRIEQQLSDEEEDALDLFVALSQRIAQAYAGFNSSATALQYICAKGAIWALQGSSKRLHFLQGVACFLSRLPSAQAQTALAEIEAAFAVAPNALAPQEEATNPWNLYYDFKNLLQERIAKGTKPKSVLKRRDEHHDAINGATSRRITFQPSDGLEELEDQELQRSVDDCEGDGGEEFDEIEHGRGDGDDPGKSNKEEMEAIMPTEEQLPILQAARSDGRKRQLQKMQPILQNEEQQYCKEAQDTDHKIASDADLPDIKGRSTTMHDEDEEDVTQEIRRPRRRRRY